MRFTAGRRGFLLLGLLGSAVAGCAAPPLTLYTLRTPSAAGTAQPDMPRGPPLGSKPMVIEIVRVTLPDELDAEDIMVRDGDVVRRSQRGRWTSRLSLGVTDRLAERLAARRPDALITDKPQTETPAYRIVINFGRLDVTAQGVATLQADWLITPRDPKRPTLRDRTRLSQTGPVATDQDVVTLYGNMLDQLAAAIDIAGLR